VRRAGRGNSATRVYAIDNAKTDSATIQTNASAWKSRQASGASTRKKIFSRFEPQIPKTLLNSVKLEKTYLRKKNSMKLSTEVKIARNLRKH